MISTIDSRFKLVQLEDAEITSFNKAITFTYEGVEYSARIYWEHNDGYDISWLNGDSPEWATNWEAADSVEYILDSLIQAEGLNF
jgi:hypothetical protein